jgi:C_GCAxxG_C_C family probable redox protein
MRPNRPDRAAALFQEGALCSQAICQAYGDELGFSAGMASRVAGGFGSGLARTDGICGAVSGAVMVLGLAFGSDDATDRPARELLYAIVQEFIAEFRDRHGSVSCTELLGYDLGNAEEAAAAREAGVVPRVCPVMVRSAAELLEEMLGRRER